MKNKKEKNLGINAILNVIRQGLSIVFPLITYPYALHVLGVSRIGKVNYGSSIISYFGLIAMLGVTNYAIREGSKKKTDANEFEKFVSEIFTINIFTTMLSYFLLFLLIFNVKNLSDYKWLLLLQSLSIAFKTFGVDWINNVFEDFFVITIRSIITHIITLVLLFAFVRTPEDYYVYALLTVITSGIICVSNWIYCRKYVKIKYTIHPNFKKHMKPLLILFANAIAISIYVNIDTTMIGWIKGDYSVGIYSAAVRIYNIVKTVLVAIYAVAVPRMSFFAGNGRWGDYKKLNTDLWCVLSLLLVPVGVGLFCLSDEIMLFLGGRQFATSGRVLQILSIALIFAIFGGLVTACMNITLGREKYTLIATTVSAGINFVLNLFVIPIFSENGAAVTTLISEGFVFMYCFIKIPKKNFYLDFVKLKKTLLHSILGAVFIIFLSIILKSIFDDITLRIFLIIIVSVIAYFICLLACKDLYLLSGIAAIKHRILKVKY